MTAEDTRASNGQFARKHGHASGKRTPTFSAWSDMIRRCEKPNSQVFSRYGARGITVCASWHTFSNFLRDMGERPARGLSLDRINNKGNYEPGNCRWADRQTQSENQDRVKQFSLNGESHCLTVWARRFGITPRVIMRRVNKLQWSLEKALAVPVARSRGSSVRKT